MGSEEPRRAALEASERRFRGLFEGAGVGIKITDLEGRFVDANPTFLDMLGYSREEMLATDSPSVTHPDDRSPNRQDIEALIAGEVPSFRTEKRYLTKDGRIVWVRATFSLIRDDDGRPLQLAATTEEITAVKLAEQRLRRSESLRRLAGELALVGGWALDASDRTVYWSEEIYRILDAPSGEEPRLEEILALYPGEDRERLEVALEACLEHGTSFDVEVEIDTFGGRRIPVRAIGEAQRDVDGRIVQVFGAFQDMSDLHRATQSAQDAARRLTASLESMTDAFFTLDRDWRFTFVNERAGELLRWAPAELIGRRIWDEFPEAVGGVAYDAYHRAMAGEGTQVIEEYHYPPLELWVSVNAYPSEQGLAVYFRDVSAQREARIALEEREAMLRRQAALLDAAQDAILVRDSDHRVTYWNRGAERIYGWSADEVRGADVRELLFEDQSTFDASTAAVLERGSWSGELTQRTRTGEPVVVAARWTLVRDDAGRPEAVLAINTDVTEQRRIEQQLLRAQRMESIGTLAGGVAHDLNNVLSPILLATELLRMGEPEEDAAQLLDIISTSARRGADLVTQVLSFARGVEGRRAMVDVAELLDDIRTIVRDTFPKSIRFELQVPGTLRGILGDSTQVQQVLLNLAVNARDAMPDGGNLTIRASEVVLDEQYVVAAPGAEPGDYVLIEVEDDGTGMSADVRERVFEPFFTTKPLGAGTGLGLSTSAAIVRSHGGFLHVYSESGQGSRFCCYLPVDSDDPASPQQPSVTELPRGRGETVLVVDDEAAVLAMTCRTLEAHGYRTLEAGNGTEAVAVFSRDPDGVDVVVTDMMMPVMDGLATIRALRKLAPEIRIVGASGLHSEGKVAAAAIAGVRHFLPKPYTTRELLEMLADVLTDDR